MKQLILIIHIVIFNISLQAQDFLAGNISLRHVGVDSIEATVNIYTDANISADRSKTVIFWGDGFHDTIARTSLISVNNEIDHHKYVAIHKYIPIFGPGGTANLSVEKQKMSNNIINWNDTSSYFIITSQFVVPIDISPSSSSQYTSFGGLQNGITKQDGKFELGLNTSSFDSLYYTIGSDTFSVGYTLPDHQNAFSFDNVTQTLIWDKPAQVGKYIMFIEARQQWYNSYTSFAVLLDVKNVVTDTDEKFDLGLELFPNPTTDLLQITTQKPLNEVQLYNTLGQQVYQQQGLQQEQVQIDVSHLPKGMYIVRVRQGENWGSEQVVIQ